MKRNKKIRDYAKEKGVHHWQIASYLHISEATMMRWLREELSTEKEKMILDAIDQIAAEVV